MLEHRSSARVAAGHPCLAGHFPGNPIVPAVLVLALVLEALQAWRGSQWRVQRILSSKFLLPLRPEESFEIVLRVNQARLDFSCNRGTQLLSQGSWELAPC